MRYRFFVNSKNRKELPFRNAAVRLRCQRSGNAPPPAIRTPGFCKRLIHPPCHIHYRSSSMKAIGIRCWPDSHHALPGCPLEGAERRGTSLRAPSHSQRPIASEAPNALTAPLVPARTSTCRRKRPGSTLLWLHPSIFASGSQAATRPLHIDVRLHTLALFAFSTGINIDRLQPPRWYASG